MEENGNKRIRGRTRGRARGRTRGRARGRSKKAVKVIESDEEDTVQASEEIPVELNEPEVEQQKQQKQQPQQKQQKQQQHQKPQQQQQHQKPQQQQQHQKPQQQQHQKPQQQQQHQKPQQQQQLPQQQQQQHQQLHDVQIHQPIPEQQFDLEADISQLEAPTFTTINRGPPEPMLRLRWDHRVNLIGEKVLNPMIHCCDKCLKPILIYGRMIPCKHVFCLSCAKREDKVCPRCLEKVTRVEQTGLGTVFMCTHGGTRYGNAGCRRTYLSQRDLQAHINHRHISAPLQSVQGMQVDQTQYAHSKSEMESQLSKTSTMNLQNSRMKQGHIVQPIMGNDPRVNSLVNQQTVDRQHRSQSMMSMQPMRTNLITVPIQDTPVNTHEIHTQQTHHYYTPPPPPPPAQVNYANYSVPPPVSQAQQYYSQPQGPYVQPSQQQYVSASPAAIRPSGYIQDPQYGPPPQQPPQSQWTQHQQQFYR